MYIHHIGITHWYTAWKVWRGSILDSGDDDDDADGARANERPPLLPPPRLLPLLAPPRPPPPVLAPPPVAPVVRTLVVLERRLDRARRVRDVIGGPLNALVSVSGRHVMIIGSLFRLSSAPQMVLGEMAEKVNDDDDEDDDEQSSTSAGVDVDDIG